MRMLMLILPRSQGAALAAFLAALVSYMTSTSFKLTLMIFSLRDHMFILPG